MVTVGQKSQALGHLQLICEDGDVVGGHRLERGADLAGENGFFVRFFRCSRLDRLAQAGSRRREALAVLGLYRGPCRVVCWWVAVARTGMGPLAAAAVGRIATGATGIWPDGGSSPDPLMFELK
jgi:hypothetical protein